MGFRNLGMAVVFVAVLAGTFGAAFAFLQTRSKVEPEALAPLPESPENVEPPPTIKEEPTTKAPEDRKPAPKSAPKKPFTCAEATKLGDDCVGRRVNWVGQWTNSQSTRIGNKEGSQHLFNTRGPKGDFSFDYPFI